MDAKKFAVMSFALLGLSLVDQACAQGDNFQPEIPVADVQVLQQARSLRAQKRQNDAVRLLLDLTKRQPDYFNAQFELAMAISDDEARIGEAIPVFQRAADIKRSNANIKDARVFNSLGWAQMYTGQRAAAQKSFDEALRNQSQLSPEVNAKLLNNIGNLRLSTGRPAEALDYFKAAAAQGNKPAKFNVGVAQGVLRTSEKN